MVFNKLVKLFKKKKIIKVASREAGSAKKRDKKLKKIARKPKKSLKARVIKKEKLIASATHYFSKIKVAVLKMKDTLNIKDKIHIKGFTTDFIQTVASMQIDRSPVTTAKKGQEIGLLVKGKVRHKDKVYKIKLK